MGTLYRETLFATFQNFPRFRVNPYKWEIFGPNFAIKGPLFQKKFRDPIFTNFRVLRYLFLTNFVIIYIEKICIYNKIFMQSVGTQKRVTLKRENKSTKKIFAP